MNKVIEDAIAREVVSDIDIYWDGRRIDFNVDVEIEDDIVTVKGCVDYTYAYEEDTNATTITWVEVTIDDIIVSHDEDSTRLPVNVNERFVKKYMEQYIIEL